MVDEQIEAAWEKCAARTDEEIEITGEIETPFQTFERLFCGEVSKEMIEKMGNIVLHNAKLSMEEGGLGHGFKTAFCMGLEIGKQFESERIHV